MTPSVRFALLVAAGIIILVNGILTDRRDVRLNCIAIGLVILAGMV